MSRKLKKIDYVLFEDNDIKVVFRMYPRKSHVHVFNGNSCTKNWMEVYKTYYAYSIIKYHKFKKNPNGSYIYEHMYVEDCDENSVLGKVSSYLRGFAVTPETMQDKYLFFPVGYGTSWELRKGKGKDDLLVIDIRMTYGYLREGVTFYLRKDQLIPFADKIVEFLQHMLEHSEPI